MPAPNAQTPEPATEFLKRVVRINAQQCPCCTTGRGRVVESMLGQRRLPELGRTVCLKGTRRRDDGAFGEKAGLHVAQ